MGSQNKTLKVISIWLIAFGLIGIFVIWILSFIIVSYKWTTGTNSPPAVIPYENNQIEIYPQIEVRGELVPFIQTYKLEILIELCFVLILIGFILFIFRKIKIFEKDNL
jgi:hypothetical protein